MKVSDALQELCYGELNTHRLADSGAISPENYSRMIHHLNMGLLALYTRFPLLVKELTLQQKSWITVYKLKKEHAVTDPSDEVKYIIDSRFDPFIGDLIRVEEVSDEVGDVVELNSTDHCKVALTPSMDTLEIPNPTDTNVLFVTYRAKHPQLVNVDSEILLPQHLLGALYAYTGMRVYAGGTSQEQLTKSAELESKYERICQKMELDGMVNTDVLVLNMKPYERGWI
jgi:hypothetical protein